MGVITLRTAIKNKLDTVSQLQAVYDYFTSDVSGFPVAMFEPTQDPSKIATNRENEHAYTFDIFILQEIQNIGRDEAIRILGGAVDAVVAAFDADPDLGANATMVEAAPTEWGEDSVGTGLVKWARVTITVYQISTAF